MRHSASWWTGSPRRGTRFQMKPSSGLSRSVVFQTRRMEARMMPSGMNSVTKRTAMLRTKMTTTITNKTNVRPYGVCAFVLHSRYVSFFLFCFGGPCEFGGGRPAIEVGLDSSKYGRCSRLIRNSLKHISRAGISLVRHRLLCSFLLVVESLRDRTLPKLLNAVWQLGKCSP